MGIATFTDADTGEGVTINADVGIIASIGRGDRGTVIVLHVPDASGGSVVKKAHVRENFWDVINELAEARKR